MSKKLILLAALGIAGAIEARELVNSYLNKDDYSICKLYCDHATKKCSLEEYVLYKGDEYHQDTYDIAYKEYRDENLQNKRDFANFCVSFLYSR